MIIIHQHNKIPLIQKKTLKKSKINRSRDRKSRSSYLLTPRRSSNSALSLHTEAVHHQEVLLGVFVFHPCLWPLKAPGFKCLHQMAPVYLTVMSDPVSASASRSHLRSAARGDLAVPRSRTTTYGQKSFSVSGPSLWNSLPLSVRESVTHLWQWRSSAHIWRLFCFAEHIVLSIAPSWQFRL